MDVLCSHHQYCLNAWACWAVARGPHKHRGLMLIYVCFLMFKHWFCCKYQYNKYMFNFIDIYNFIPVNGCVGVGPSATLCPRAYNAVKTALLTMEVLCSYNVCIMLLPWKYYALIMELLCFCHGGIMLLPWRFMLSPGRYYALTMNGIQIWKSINNKSFLFAKIIPLHVKKCYFRASGNEIMYNNNLYSCDI